MALPWGVKEEVDPAHGEAVTEFMANVEGTKIELSTGDTVEMLKVGVKERKGKYMLIFRYVIV